MTSSAGRSLSPQTSMTLSVSRDDARRMLEASAALNNRLAVLQEQGASSGDPAKANATDDDPSVPKRVVSSSDNESDTEKEEFRHLVQEAASSCGDPLVQSVMASLHKSGIPNREIRVCLLLFLDMGKSTKLLKAFQTLTLSKEKNEQDPTKLTIKKEGAVTLFRCLLTAISLCIHQTSSSSTTTKDLSEETSVEQPRKALKESDHSSPNSSAKTQEATEDDDQGLPRASPSFDSSMGDGVGLSEEVLKEIDEIASFASEHLVDHVKKQRQDETVSSITFEDFGSWYNDCGCSIVAWLELLDLSKWEAAGQANDVEASKQRDAMSLMAQETSAMALETKPSELPEEPPRKPSPAHFFDSNNMEHGRTSPSTRPIVSFDFTGAMSTPDGSKRMGCPFRIDLSEDNLVMLRNLVYRTGTASRLPHEVSEVLLRHSTKCIVGGKELFLLHRSAFAACIRELVRPEAYRNFSKKEMEDFSICFTDFFSCFEYVTDGGVDQVNVKDLAVGFSFLCAGNKSSKLALGFELLDEDMSGQLLTQQIEQYIRSYLKMLVGISLLSSSPGDKKELSIEQRKAMNTAVENGALWTIGHVLKYFAENGEANKQIFTFENFAKWYTVGGYKVAPWLELLDLSKLLALLGDVDPASSKGYGPPPSSNRLRQTNRSSRTASSEVLFTFPLANRRSLVVLREDALYVRSVVEKLALLSLSTEELWSSLFKRAKAQPVVSPVAPRRFGTGKSMDVSQETFVRCMVGIMEHIAGGGRKRSASNNSKVSTAARETLMNFYHSFDLEQVDRVGLNELMGGLCLLCGGKKSTKLAFAFGLFDGRNNNAKKSRKNDKTHSLKGEELFMFLRSFLIVMFSCCQQSMDLSAEAVGQHISDSARMVANDVMRYQWHTRKKDRVNFDEFGEWYNEGGFETAPWLELLDLAKWVLADNVDTVQHQRALPPQSDEPFRPTAHSRDPHPQGGDCPPPPPEDALDASFFADDMNPLMQMGSMDEMDMMLMQQTSQDKENESFAGNKLMNAFPLSPHQRPPPQSSSTPNSSLKFHLVTYEEHGGYMLSVSQERVSHLRHLLVESGLYQVSAEEASRIILSQATPSSKKGARAKSPDLFLTKDAFDAAVGQIISHGRGKANMTVEAQRVLLDLFAWVFTMFDRARNGKACAMEVACGLMVLCAGKKSDKLEYGFEVLDKDRQGKLARREMSNYLKSFLTVLLSIASAPCLHSDLAEDSINYMHGGVCDRSALTITRAAERGSDWAARQAFDAAMKAGDESAAMSFDSFADWYTRVGYTSIPWLELLDLRKWVLTSR